MTRVLHIVQRFGAGGGIDRFVSNCIEKMDPSVYHFDILTHDSKKNTYNELASKVQSNIYTFDKLSFDSIKMNSIKFRTLIEKNRYDIVHCHMVNAAFLYLKIALQCGIKVRILHSHQNKYADQLTHSIRNVPLAYFGKQYANIYVACSQIAGDFLFGQNKYVVIKNGIDTKQYQFNTILRYKIRSQYNISDTDKVLLFLGRLTNQKNPILAIKIFSQLVHNNEHNWKMIIAGDGNLHDSIVKEINRCGMKEKILLVGEVNFVTDLLSAADALIMPSKYEGFGYSALEAQASGLPCIISNKFPEEIDITNLVYRCDLDASVSAWAQEIESAISINTQRGKYSELIKNNGFDIVNTMQSLDELYYSSVKNFS